MPQDLVGRDRIGWCQPPAYCTMNDLLADLLVSLLAALAAVIASSLLDRIWESF